MMEITSFPHLLEQIKTLVSEGNSMAKRLEESEYIIGSRDKEIEFLQQMVTDANTFRSSLENQLIELQEMKDGMKVMKQLADTASYTKEGLTAKQDSLLKEHSEISRLKNENAQLALQLADLKNELEEMKSMKMLFIEQNKRISRLENLLKITEEERDMLKNKSPHSRAGGVI
jgi:chromosome segregation ATPase